MRFYEFASSQLRPSNYKKFDSILIDLCELIRKGQQKDNSYYGLVAACVLDPQGNKVSKLNHRDAAGKRIHAERAAINAYVSEHGKIPKGTIVITTLSPCTEPMDERHGRSCRQLIGDTPIREVYCGYTDPTQGSSDHKFKIKSSGNTRVQKLCKHFADKFLKI
jgi:pyrimidine deaminase RibD-like protein